MFSGGIVVLQTFGSYTIVTCGTGWNSRTLDLNTLGDEFASKCDCCQEDGANDISEGFRSDHLLPTEVPYVLHSCCPLNTIHPAPL